jgi:hypothetical protein
VGAPAAVPKPPGFVLERRRVTLVPERLRDAPDG